MVRLPNRYGLHRYWFQFDAHHLADRQRLARCFVLAGCGVTAWNEADARWLIRKHLFEGDPLPPIRSITVDVDISTLDPRHVRPNMGICAWRGVWFPCLGGSRSRPPG